jgi:hypothetical protein
MNLGKIRVAAGLGKPAAGDADMGDVAPRLTNQFCNPIEDYEDLSPILVRRAKYGHFCLSVHLALLGIDMTDDEKR